MLRCFGALLIALHPSEAYKPAPGPELCVVPAGLPVRPYTTCSDLGSPSALTTCREDGARGNLAGQRGESEVLQLLLRNEANLDDLEGGLRNVSMSVSASSRSIECTPFQVGYVDTKRTIRYEGSGGGWRPDPLIPLTGLGFDVPSSTSQALWISCDISRSCEPGKYTANVTVRCSDSKCGPNGLAVPLDIHVWNIDIPLLNESDIGQAWSGTWTSANFAPYYGDDYWNRSSHEWYDLLLHQRTSPDTLYLKSPRPIEDYEYLHSQGMAQFGVLDVNYFHSGAAPRSHTGLAAGKCPINFTQESVWNLIEFLRPTVEQLQKRSLLSKAYIYGFDELPPSCEPQIRLVFGATKRAFPGLRTAATLNWSPMPTDLPVDIWIMGYSGFNATDAAAWVAAGKDQWHYHCIEPSSLQNLNTFIERPVLEGRLLFWLAALNNLRYGAPTGWLYYSMVKWMPCDSYKCGGAVVPQVLRRKNVEGAQRTAFTDFPPANFIWRGQLDDIFANGDGQFLYPCPDGPCNTIRLEGIRDGLEDWELIAKVGKAAIPFVEQLVRSAEDWTADPWLLENVRRQLAAMIDRPSRFYA